jgi:hypothetical protein
MMRDSNHEDTARPCWAAIAVESDGQWEETWRGAEVGRYWETLELCLFSGIVRNNIGVCPLSNVQCVHGNAPKILIKQHSI